MEIKKIDLPVHISDDSKVRLKVTGNISEVMYSEKRSRGGYIKKIDKDNYVDVRTGEVNQFNHIENRSQDLNNVAKSLAFGRDMLNSNITDVSFCRWVTLTYADNMTSPEKLASDFKHFNSRCRSIFGHYEYITCAEPQARGAWHLHCVFIFPHKAPYMANDTVFDCWKQGFVTVKRLDNVDNVGAYLTAYLGDMELSEASSVGVSFAQNDIKEIEFEDDNGEKCSKKYIKGARLYMYPPGFHIFRYSKGVKKPDVTMIDYKTAKEKISSAKLTFSKTLTLCDADSNYSNVLHYDYYNTIRK